MLVVVELAGGSSSKEVLRLSGDRTGLTGSDRSAVDLPDRRHFGSCTGEKHLVRGVKCSTGKVDLAPYGYRNLILYI